PFEIGRLDVLHRRPRLGVPQIIGPDVETVLLSFPGFNWICHNLRSRATCSTTRITASSLRTCSAFQVTVESATPKLETTSFFRISLPALQPNNLRAAGHRYAIGVPAA